MLRKGHELGFPLKKAQRALGKSVKIENLQGARYWPVLGRFGMIRRVVHD